MEERREFMRLTVGVEVRWQRIDSDANPDDTITKNISEGGICLITDELLTPGDKLQLEIILPSERIIHAKGKVVWVDTFQISGGKEEKRYDAGIMFVQINPDDKTEIARFVFRNIYNHPSRPK